MFTASPQLVALMTEIINLRNEIRTMSTTLEAQMRADTASIQNSASTIMQTLAVLAAKLAAVAPVAGTVISQDLVDTLSAARAAVDTAVAAAAALVPPASTP